MSGYDSLNRKRKKPKYLSGPGQAEAAGRSRQSAAADCVERRGCGYRFRRRRPPTRRRIPPAMAGTVVGPAAAQAAQDRRRSVRRGRRLRRQLPDQVRGRTLAAATTPIPAERRVPQGSPFYVIAPEFVAFSDWERHALVADLRGSFTGYTNNLPPVDGVGSSAPTEYRPAGFHRPCRRPPRCQPRHPPARPGAIARRDRQSRQPERAGRPVQISGLRDVRRHASASIRTSTACSFPPALRSTAPSINTRS